MCNHHAQEGKKREKMKLLSAQISLWYRKVNKVIPSQCSSVHSSFYLHVESLAVDSPLVRESIDIATRVDIVPWFLGLEDIASRRASCLFCL